MADLVFTDNTMYYEIPAAPYQRFTVEFTWNFYVIGAKELRGEEYLAMVVMVAAAACWPVASEFIWNRPLGVLFIVTMCRPA